jgi:hypothetical protein
MLPIQDVVQRCLQGAIVVVCCNQIGKVCVFVAVVLSALLCYQLSSKQYLLHIPRVRSRLVFDVALLYLLIACGKQQDYNLRLQTHTQTINIQELMWFLFDNQSSLIYPNCFTVLYLL